MAPDLNPALVKQANNGSGAAPPHLPLIDLSGLDGPQHDQVVKTLVKAAKLCGFFQVVNHGLSVELLESVKHLVHCFFNKPAEEKRVYEDDIGESRVVLYHQSPPPELGEFLIMRYTNEEEALKLWPDSCKETLLEYRKLSTKMSERILQILLGDLDVTLDDSMADALLGGTIVTMNYYPTLRNLDPERVSGLNHTDQSTLTILLQDHVGGLFSKLRDEGDMENNYKGEWVQIPPTPGALIVMIGDSLEVLSNGNYTSAEHCVPKAERDIRISCPVFVNPRSSTRVRPLPQLVEKDGGKPRYKEIVYGEYEAYKYASHPQGLKPINSLKIQYS